MSSFVEDRWQAFCGPPLQLILQYLSRADCNKVLHVLLLRGCDLRDACSWRLRQAWDPEGATQKGNLAALEYYFKNLREVIKERPPGWWPNGYRPYFTTAGRANVVVLNHIMQAALSSNCLAAVRLCKKEGGELKPKEAMVVAALYGRLEIVRLLRAWGCPVSVRAMHEAARLGHIAVLQELSQGRSIGDGTLLAAAKGRFSETLQWCIDQGPPAEAIKIAMIGAAREGRLQSVLLLRAAGAPNINAAMAAAAGGGHLALIEQCIDWGATDFNRALKHAAGCNWLEIMRFCVERGATDYDSALVAAAMNGKIEAMEFCRGKATDFNAAMAVAACYGYLESRFRAMVLCKEWGATDYNRALIAAASGITCPAVLELCRDWGATDFKGALAAAVAHRREKAADLLRTW